ncbi:hypothetical protein [Clostridium estertheticum]|uniref:hypothetical protein n=1 Tax=Clostridium estertheticum TaxID=238834 RepID=UPI00129CC403|nr:hypothetical protein [Clostridium estertheticum]
MSKKTSRFWNIVVIIFSVLAIICELLDKHYLILIFMIPQILIAIYSIKNFGVEK